MVPWSGMFLFLTGPPDRSIGPSATVVGNPSVPCGPGLISDLPVQPIPEIGSAGNVPVRATGPFHRPNCQEQKYKDIKGRSGKMPLAERLGSPDRP
ncbi:MAG TPA: hypothetical protein VFD35_10370 [Pricia sp.]|nr:hypothetical protein [Pricia sp.]